MKRKKNKRGSPTRCNRTDPLYLSSVSGLLGLSVLALYNGGTTATVLVAWVVLDCLLPFGGALHAYLVVVLDSWCY